MPHGEAAGQMDPFEIDMLEFAAKWAPYGGNDDEAFIRFGLRPTEFHLRLLGLLSSPGARALQWSTVITLRWQCHERLGRLAVGAS
ncbi:DUF3263 domain-containing protein [Nocardia rhizosphaerihabitans]|uniref:DUF3263 domain-containing protein n=1 Tax=Nocardia rhizosphaerihabitans TaxID=1691570 RepID=A0ABQ2KBL8_9NOCA|nr:DUF3263 domain-containing protein [Nocardia rhizosphaerihabitans]GGN78639.1 hypothetical protein GCM10011610_26410 [Nocardia rhizosphaerihabitans]